MLASTEKKLSLKSNSSSVSYECYTRNHTSAPLEVDETLLQQENDKVRRFPSLERNILDSLGVKFHR